ncbi:MAG: hypothetical protein AAB323_00365 [Pseudomonadota bacterium]
MPRFVGGGFGGGRGGSGLGFFGGLLAGSLFGGGLGGYGSYPTYSGSGFAPTAINPYSTGLLVTDSAGNTYLVPYGNSYPNWLLGSPAYGSFYGGLRGGGMRRRWF